MILIIGGAYQGKTEYAKKTYGLQDADIFTCENTDIDPNARAIRHLERFALACVRTGKEPAEELKALDLSEKILICEAAEREIFIVYVILLYLSFLFDII